MTPGERQVAPTVEGIRRDHVARYEWAAKQLPKGARVVDVACGIGYGSKILAEAGHKVLAIDQDEEAIAYGREHYGDERITYRVADAEHVEANDIGPWTPSAAVCFETLEHLRDPLPLLKALRARTDKLLVSAPNEKVFPYQGQRFHHRHYMPVELQELLQAAGWRVTSWWGQAGPESEVEHDKMGRTLIAVAMAAIEPKPVDLSGCDLKLPDPAPEHVAICALGPSVSDYLEFTKRIGGRHKYADETWAVNALGDVLAADRVFHMDDVRIQEIRAAARPDSNIATMLKWLKRHPGPVYTSRPHPDYPGLVPFPLEAVVRDTGYSYLNSTAAYAVAFAVWLRVKKISLFGMDFTYAHSHHAERGRACVEFWLGIAAARGIKLSIPKRSSLMDGCESYRARLYGYDTLDVKIERDGEGKHSVSFTERQDPLPTAEEIEARYDHSAHVNPLVERGQS